MVHPNNTGRCTNNTLDCHQTEPKLPSVKDNGKYFTILIHHKNRIYGQFSIPSVKGTNKELYIYSWVGGLNFEKGPGKQKKIEGFA